MARIRITNSPLAGHKALSLESTGKTEGIRRMEVLTQAQATLRNMHSRAVTIDYEAEFVNFMYASVGQARVESGGRMFEGMQTQLGVQAGRGTWRALTSPGLIEIYQYVSQNIVDGSEYTGVSSASSQASGMQAWRAVDNNWGPDWRTADGTLPAWWKYDFRLPVYIRSYDIGASGGAASQPKAWELQGSHDNTNWTTIDTRSGVTSWDPESYKFYTLSAVAFYRYYRIYITEGNDPAYVSINEVRLRNDNTTGSGPSLWTPFTDTVTTQSLRVGCLVPVAAAAPLGLGAAVVSGGSHTWYSASGVALKDTRNGMKAYMGVVTLGQPTAEHPVQVVSPQTSPYGINGLAAERIT